MPLANQIARGRISGYKNGRLRLVSILCHRRVRGEINHCQASWAVEKLHLLDERKQDGLHQPRESLHQTMMHLMDT
jgi:hypothetical protein